jgi:hypothetical protein
MPYVRRSYSEIAVETTLNGGINDSVESLAVADATGFPTGSGGNFYIRIENETIDIDTRTGTSFTVQSGGRGALSTTAAAHVPGVVVTLVFTSGDADEANLAVAKTIGQASAVGQVLVVDAANSFAAVQAKDSGKILVGNGTTLASVAMSGDASLASTGALTIANGAVEAAMIADLAVTNGKAGFAASTYTPTLVQSGSVNKTVTTASYWQLGDLILARIILAVTGSGTTNNNVVVGAPVEAAVAGECGTFTVSDTSAGLIYRGFCRIVGTDLLGFRTDSQVSTAIGVSPNFALASGDSVTITAMYEGV